MQINSFGAEVISVKDNNLVEFIWQGDKVVWARHAPVLFPIVGKLKNDRFIVENKNYELPQHGFARDMNFETVVENNNSCAFRLSSGIETYSKFPFDFIFEIKYALTDNILTTFYTVKNPSEKQIYFSLGAHPGFNCPLLTNETFEDYYLEFEMGTLKTTELYNGLLKVLKNELSLPNKTLALSSSLFDNDALVFEDNQIHSVNLCSNKSAYKIEMECRDWPYFGIWTKKGQSRFICLEPWFGAADSIDTDRQFANKKGILTLLPLTEFNCSFSCKFSNG